MTHARLEFDDADDLRRLEFSDPAAWSVREGRLQVGESSYVPPFRSPASIALLRGDTFDDLTLRLRAGPLGEAYPHQDICIFFAFQDPSHYRYVHIARTADETAHSFFVVDGADRVRSPTQRDSGVDWDRERTITFVRARGVVELFVDDPSTPVLRATDGGGRGRVGIGSFDDPAAFDWLTIEGESYPSSSPAFRGP